MVFRETYTEADLAGLAVADAMRRAGRSEFWQEVHLRASSDGELLVLHVEVREGMPRSAAPKEGEDA